jgi:outer membrane protein OmpA-like peptidoglycan-associated protein
VCDGLNKKRRKAPRKQPHYVQPGNKRYAEGGPISFNPYGNDPKSSSHRVTVVKTDTEPPKSLSNMTLDEKHHVEDDVLKKNHLPEPTSEKHEQIRKDVEKHLGNFEEESPLKLEPLYFVVDQDEFAFVDMDPFLIAVEYALQGKHVLIEGHTDASGQSGHNVQLSIKRVERIRQLMQDMGVSDDHISVVGYGEEHSEDASKATEDKQLDRRVDFTVF